ncbi:MAG: tryptophan synthase subunit alpha [Dissulfurimicrobium sp.]|uniref:tryptophan synthase subunit alpha n=1 Tax=Dissulfurimicrobium sp. TaxID=2022436 RepID=UPI003D0D84DB
MNNRASSRRRNRIDQAFSRLKRVGESAFIPFITAGDPDIAVTKALVKELVSQGADIIELGLPFSDPLADGPTIQAASQRALRNNINITHLFELVSGLRSEGIDVPLVLMGYYNSILQYGLEKFAADAASIGFDGTIVPDLPLEESVEWVRASRRHNLSTIFLVAPTTPPERARRIAKASRGFIYYVSVTGITGARNDLPSELLSGIKTVKNLTSLPVAVGFGVSRPEQVAMLSAVADGIIVGSAIVRLVEENLIKDGGTYRPGRELINKVGDFVERLKAETRKKTRSVA